MEPNKNKAWSGSDQRPMIKSPQIRTRSFRNYWKMTGAACIALFVLLRWFYHRVSNNTFDTLDRIGSMQTFADERFDLGIPWRKLRPSRTLDFSDCFDGHQCARLSVPMDWNSTVSDAATVDLAIIKRPAKVPLTDPRYGGLLWLQTGGPGSSGVEFLLRQGKTVQMIVDSSLDPSIADYEEPNPPKYFDVIGFDPRGINNTTPRLTCFPDAVARDLWALRVEAEGVLGSSNYSLTNAWARTSALSEGCSRRMTESDNPDEQLAFHMNTSPVVADIVEVIEQYGKWREEETIRLIARQKAETRWVPFQKTMPMATTAGDDDEIRERTRWRKGEEKIRYWGLSYGTIIGATLATMQPHRIERAIIDGVADTSDYYSGQWRSNLEDTDNILDKFSEYCSKADPVDCALYLKSGPSAIKHKFKDTVNQLKSNPIGVVARDSFAPDIVTYSDIKGLIGQAVYAPLQFFPFLASILAELSHGNDTSLSHLKQSGSPIHSVSKHCQHAAPYSQECAIADKSVIEIPTAILCSDGNTTCGMSKEEYFDYISELEEKSWLIGDLWAQIRMGCVRWNIKPKWRFGGPFEGVTAKPMLIVGTKNDPVTPIRNAHSLAKRFPGSAVLTLDAEGHTIMSSPSLCMADHVRTYFQSGSLPEPGTMCETNEKPFIGLTKPVDPSDKAMLEQLRWTATHLFS